MLLTFPERREVGERYAQRTLTLKGGVGCNDAKEEEGGGVTLNLKRKEVNIIKTEKKNINYYKGNLYKGFKIDKEIDLRIFNKYIKNIYLKR